MMMIQRKFPNIKLNEPLRNHSSFHTGGNAKFFYELFNIEELPELIKFCAEHQIPYFIIGRGTNMLFSDNGFRGLVIKNFTNEIKIQGLEITADSGVLLAEIIKQAVSKNLTGLEWLYGLPGTIGSALYGNAGIPKSRLHPKVEIGDFVKNITCFNIEEGIHTHEKEELNFSYRNSRLKQEKKDVILTVILKLKKAKSKKLNLQKILKKVRQKQPAGFTCGSFFKNPKIGVSAGYLIDQCGLKGFRIGEAYISEKHANFFINSGNASSKDILELAKIAKKEVKKKFGIVLEEEVIIVGETARVSLAKT